MISADVDGSGGGGGAFFAVPLAGGGVLVALVSAGASACACFFFLAMLGGQAAGPWFAMQRGRVVRHARRHIPPEFPALRLLGRRGRLHPAGQTVAPLT
jgi:hypothetical protein